jgi:hypothetical protein
MKETDLDALDAVRVPEDLVRAVNQLKEQAGMSIRRANELATEPGMVALPRSTLAEILSGRRFPTKEQLGTFVRVCGVTDEAPSAAWDSAWERANEEYQRFGSVPARPAVILVSSLLEAGPMGAGKLVLRRSIPEAAEELSKVPPGTAAEILGRWPATTSAEIVSAMNPGSAVAILLSMRSFKKVGIGIFSPRSYVNRVINGMKLDKAAALLDLVSVRDAAKIVESPRSSLVTAVSEPRRAPLRRAAWMNFTREVIVTYAAIFAVGGAIYAAGKFVESRLNARSEQST